MTLMWVVDFYLCYQTVSTKQGGKKTLFHGDAKRCNDIQVNRVTENYGMWHPHRMGAHRKVSDEQIAVAVASLFGRDASAWPTVIEVADRLRRDHGHQGTHERIRAVLAKSRDTAAQGGESKPTGNTDWRKRAIELRDELACCQAQANARIETLEAELRSMRQRAELAEAREDSSTERWMMEVDHLRQELQNARRPTGVPHEQYLAVYRELVTVRAELVELRRVGIASKEG